MQFNFFRNKNVNPQKKSSSGIVASRSRWFLTKRKKFLIVSLLLTLGLFVVQRFPIEQRYLIIIMYGFMSYTLSGWSLIKDLKGVGWFTNLILPTLFPVSVSLFYFLLPQGEITRLIVGFIFLILMYALLLTVNIFAIASMRTIQLLRAARAVGFLLIVVTSAFFYHYIFSIKVNVLYIILLTISCTLPLFISGMWQYTLGDTLQKNFWKYVLVGTTIVVEVTVALSFWLVDVALASIFLAMIMYVLLGLMQHDVEERLFARTVQEFFGFATIVFLIITSVIIVRWVS